MIVLCGIKFLNGHCADLHTYKYSGGVVCMCECICRWGRHKTYRRTERQHWGRAVAVNLMPTRRFLAQQTQRLFSLALPTRLFSLCVSLPWCAQYPVGCWNVLKRVFWRCTNFAWRTSHWVCVYICIYSHIYIYLCTIFCLEIIIGRFFAVLWTLLAGQSPSAHFYPTMGRVHSKKKNIVWKTTRIS